MSASLPHRPASSQRRSSHEQSSELTRSQRGSSPAAAHSEESYGLFRNSGGDAPQQQEEEQTTAPAGMGNADDDPSVKKCWICFSDSTEDTPQTSPWRSPCPCALVAHEACLLDWIADVEAPHSRRVRIHGRPKIECPQCKSPIHLAQPKSLVVDAYRSVERLCTNLVIPVSTLALSGTIYYGSMFWGIHSIYTVFGAEDGFRILEPIIVNRVRPPIILDGATFRKMGERLFGSILDHLVHWRLYVGLPLITPVVILSRTRLAEPVLSILPIVFFATQAPSPGDTIEFGSWPPSASLAFAILPYIRSAYNFYYQKVWAAREKSWIKRMEPRATQGETSLEELRRMGVPDDAIEEEDDENVLEIRVDAEIIEEVEDEEDALGHEQPNLDAQGLPPPVAADGDRPVLAADPENPDAQQAAPNANNGAEAAAGGWGGERRLAFSPSAVAETVAGALIFPSIASVSGELLKLVLPHSWTTPSLAAGTRITRLAVRTPAKGLLQEKWGRALIGGCLFVVLKDAVNLYVRWKLAQMQDKRKILNYDKSRSGKTGT